MRYIFVSPGKYIQDQNALAQLGEYASPLGKKAYVLLSRGGKERFGERIEKSFSETEADCVIAVFGGECTEKEIKRQAECAREQECDVIVGVGGGKVLDTSKLTAVELGLPVIICPTIASTDAPTPGRAVLYSEEGVSIQTLQLPANPQVVLVDSQIIAEAPLRLLVSGMGDALATYFETRVCIQTGSENPAGGHATMAATGLSEYCFKTLMEYGVQAKEDAARKECTVAVERIIEANTLLSGLGFESGGLASAHAINKGLTHVKKCDAYYHGEKVAYGTLCQLLMEKADPELIDQVFRFCKAVGLPTTLAEIGLAADEKEELMTAATVAADPNGHSRKEPFTVTPEMVYEAMLEVDRIGRSMTV